MMKSCETSPLIEEDSISKDTIFNQLNLLDRILLSVDQSTLLKIDHIRLKEVRIHFQNRKLRILFKMIVNHQIIHFKQIGIHSHQIKVQIQTHFKIRTLLAQHQILSLQNNLISIKTNNLEKFKDQIHFQSNRLRFYSTQMCLKQVFQRL